MGTTPFLNLPYPEPGDPPAGAIQMQTLAAAVEQQLLTIRPEMGVTPVTLSSANAVTVSINHSLGVIPVLGQGIVKDTTFRGLFVQWLDATTTTARFFVASRDSAAVTVTTQLAWALWR